jgi:transcriptional regulator with XRE-family HTH domain
VALTPSQAGRLARALRDLREKRWPEHVLTQAQLAKALSSEDRVAAATLSSWESETNPNTPSILRVSALARFYSTQRSLEYGSDGEPHLIPEDQLSEAERVRFRELEAQLLQLLQPEDRKIRRTFQFDEGPVILICPAAPPEARGPLADERDPNFTKLQRYGDLDALIELYGHVRAENPNLDVFHRIPSDVVADDFSSHVILLGGIGWNKVTGRFQRAIQDVPVRQIEVDDLKTGEIFEVGSDGSDAERFYPDFIDLGDGEELIEDVGLLAQLRNPFQTTRTLTICNGIHSRGVYGAVRCLTDAKVREQNERFLADRFPDGEFAILLRIPIVANETLSPYLQNPAARLYEWAPKRVPDNEFAGSSKMSS